MARRHISAGRASYRSRSTADSRGKSSSRPSADASSLSPATTSRSRSPCREGRPVGRHCWHGTACVPSTQFTCRRMRSCKAWYKNQGNREMYVNCAAVTISGGGQQMISRAKFNTLPSVEKRTLGPPGPQVFLANLGNGCSTQAGTDVEFRIPETASSAEARGTPLHRWGIVARSP
jgi:hypothetical protein